ERVLETADVLDVVVDRIGHRDDAARVDAHLLSGREIELEHIAAGMEKDQAMPGQLLQDEALAAEQTGAETFRERDRQIDVADSAEERVALRQHRVAAQLQREDLSGDRIG